MNDDPIADIRERIKNVLAITGDIIAANQSQQATLGILQSQTAALWLATATIARLLPSDESERERHLDALLTAFGEALPSSARADARQLLGIGRP